MNAFRYQPLNYFRPLRFAGLLFLAFALFSCGQGKEKPADTAEKSPAAKDSTEPAGEDGRTPVTVTTISQEAMNDYIELNAVSAFLKRSYVKANANGYLQSADVFPGKYVSSGQLLFTLKTKEAQSIGNTIRILDSTLKFSGVNRINAGQNGFISQLNHQSGDYVQDGEQLAVISDRNSFVFLLDLPYEWRPYILHQHTVELVLPDNTKLSGTIGQIMPTVDSASQTQNVVIHVDTRQAIPENLIAKVRILRSSSSKALSLPKSAVLTDETETSFWVMKLIDSSTAVKVPVKPGLSSKDRIEILSPVFSPDDRILVTGNYGLPDTAKVNASPAKPE